MLGRSLGCRARRTLGEAIVNSSCACRQCDAFFKKLFEGQAELAFATHPMVWNAMQRASYWDKAKAIAYEQIPQLRREIEKTARSVIHEP